MSSNVHMTSDGVPFIEDWGLDQRIPENLQTDILVWVHEFSEWTVVRVLFDLQTFPIFKYRRQMNKYAHSITSMIVKSGYMYKNHVLQKQPEDYHIFRQKTLNSFWQGSLQEAK